MFSLTLRNNLNGIVTSNTYIDEDWPNHQFGNLNTLYIGSSGTNKRQNGLFYFPLSGIPNNAIIDSAELLLTPVSSIPTSFTTIIGRITQQNWTEPGATWNKYDGTNNWNIPGGDVDSPSFFSSIPSTGSSFVISGFIDLVQDAINNRSDELDFRIAKLNPVGSANAYLWSDDGMFQTLRPTLTIYYALSESGSCNFFTIGKDVSGLLDGDNVSFYLPCDDYYEKTVGASWVPSSFLPSFVDAIIISGITGTGKSLRCPKFSGYRDLEGAQSMCFCAWTNNCTLNVGFSDLSYLFDNCIKYQPMSAPGIIRIDTSGGGLDAKFLVPTELDGTSFDNLIFLVHDVRVNESNQWEGRTSINGQPWQTLVADGETSFDRPLTDSVNGLVTISVASGSANGIADEICFWTRHELFSEAQLNELWQLGAIYGDPLDTYVGHAFMVNGNFNLFVSGDYGSLDKDFNLLIIGKNVSGLLDGNNTLFYLPCDDRHEKTVGNIWTSTISGDFVDAIVNSGFVGTGNMTVATYKGYRDLENAESVCFCGWTNNAGLGIGFSNTSYGIFSDDALGYRPLDSPGVLKVYSSGAGSFDARWRLPLELNGTIFNDFIFVICDTRVIAGKWETRLSINGQPFVELVPAGIEHDYDTPFTQDPYAMIIVTTASGSTSGVWDELCLWARHGLFTDDEVQNLWQLGAIYNDPLDTYTGHAFIRSGILDLLSLGHEIITDNVDLYIGGSLDINDNVNLFIYGNIQDNDPLDLFIVGNLSINTNNNLYIYGKMNHINNINLFAYGKDSVINSLNFTINGYLSDNNNIELYVDGLAKIIETIKITLRGGNFEDCFCSFYINGSDTKLDFANLFVNGNILKENNSNFYIRGCIINNDCINFYVHGIDNISNTNILSICGDLSLDNNINNFIYGHDNINDNLLYFINGGLDVYDDNIFFLIIGAKLPEPIECPILDSTASIQIGDDLIEIYQSRIDALINQLGKHVMLNFDPKLDPCPNCFFDTITKRSTGIYIPGGPIPFARGRQCPFCKARGFLETPVQKCIQALIKFNPKDAINYGISVDKISSIIRLKTYFTLADDFIKTKSAYIDYDNIGVLKIVAKLIRGPIPVGLRESRYCITFWTQVDI